MVAVRKAGSKKISSVSIIGFGSSPRPMKPRVRRASAIVA
jgi:hypothetical protein